MTDRRSTYRPRRAGAANVEPYVRAWLAGSDENGAAWAPLFAEKELPAAWEAVRDDVLGEHVREHPGTRPRGWWLYDAPAERQKLSGTGETWGMSLTGLTPTGLYNNYPRPDEINSPYLKGYPINPDDPPVFEAQATYLDRLGVFLPGERRRLTAKDFEPETFMPKGTAR
jgi:hypothetical protein